MHGKFKFTDLIPGPLRGRKPGKAAATPETLAEQAREAMESEQARNAGPSRRERMVDIGRGRQQSGRQGS